MIDIRTIMKKSVFEFVDGTLRVAHHGFGSVRVVGNIGNAYLNFILHSDSLYEAIFDYEEGNPRSEDKWQHARQVIYGMAMIELDDLRKEGLA